jgi:3-dehydroquinate dehydratase II
VKILVLNGPNLNLLGTREPALYGSESLAEITARLDAVAVPLAVVLEHFQSNHEGALVDRLQEAAASGVAGVVVNGAAYSHTSIALRDAVLATALPCVEVHLTNVARREPFRRRSLLAGVAVGVVSGFGAHGYELALRGLVAALRARKT